MRWKISFQISEIFVTAAAFGVVVAFKCENASAAATAAYVVYGCIECTISVTHWIFLFEIALNCFSQTSILFMAVAETSTAAHFISTSGLSPVGSLFQRIQFVVPLFRHQTINQFHTIVNFCACNPISFIHCCKEFMQWVTDKLKEIQHRE